MGYEAFGDEAFGDEAFGDAALGDAALGDTVCISGTLSRGEEFDLIGDLGGEVVDLAGAFADDVDGMGSLRVSLGTALTLETSFTTSFVTFNENRGKFGQ